MLPIIQLKHRKFHESIPDAFLVFFLHTIAGTSIAGNIRLFRNEQSATRWIQLCWLQMHKQGLFTRLLYPWCAPETQNAQCTAKDTLCQEEERRVDV